MGTVPFAVFGEHFAPDGSGAADGIGGHGEAVVGEVLRDGIAEHDPQRARSEEGTGALAEQIGGKVANLHLASEDHRDRNRRVEVRVGEVARHVNADRDGEAPYKSYLTWAGKRAEERCHGNSADTEEAHKEGTDELTGELPCEFHEFLLFRPIRIEFRQQRPIGAQSLKCVL